jgi:hypothetical protein
MTGLASDAELLCAGTGHLVCIIGVAAVLHGFYMRRQIMSGDRQGLWFFVPLLWSLWLHTR